MGVLHRSGGGAAGDCRLQRPPRSLVRWGCQSDPAQGAAKAPPARPVTLTIELEIFLGDQEGSFTLSDLLRYGFEHRTGTVIECGDVEAFIADLYTRRRKVGPHQAFETDLMDGRWFFMNQTVLPNGWILIVGTDITALKHNEKTLRQAAETDPLTGLANRRQMFGLLDRALANLATEPFCLALVDIDRFKGINDRFGHPAGDAVLKHFADLVRHRLGNAGSFGRIGGEEFMLLLPGLDIGEAEELL